MVGTMLYLDIQKGEEAMTTLEFQQEIGGTAACMKIMIRGTKWCGQLICQTSPNLLIYGLV